MVSNKSSRRNKKPLVLIEPTITSIDNPDGLSAQLDREMAFDFENDPGHSMAVPSPKAKPPTPKRSTKYKAILGKKQQKQQQQKKQTKEIPVLQPLYISNSPRNSETKKKRGTIDRDHLHNNLTPGDKTIHSLSSGSNSNSIPRHPYANQNHRMNPVSPSATVRRTNSNTKPKKPHLSMVIKDDCDDYSDDSAHENNPPGRSNKYKSTLLRHRERSLQLEKEKARQRSSSSHGRFVSSPRAGGRRSLSPTHRQRSFSVDESCSETKSDNKKVSSSHARLPSISIPMSPFSRIRQRSFSFDEKKSKNKNNNNNPESPSNAKTSKSAHSRRPRSPFANLSKRGRQRSFSADDKKGRNKAAAEAPAVPSPRAKPLSPLARSLLSRRHQRRFEKHSNKPDPRPSVSAHARLPSGGGVDLNRGKGSNSYQTVASVRDFDASSSNGFSASYPEGRPWTVTNSGGLSLVSSLNSSKNNHSKNSRASSLASSLDATASPDEIIAFGAVMDHITKGGSLFNVNKIFQKEFKTRDQYRSEDPIEANYNNAQLHHGKLPPTFVKRKEYKYKDDSYEEVSEQTPPPPSWVSSEDNRNVSNKQVVDMIKGILGTVSSDPTYESEIGSDRYSTKHEENDDETRDESKSDDSDDWCVPRPPAEEDEETAGTGTQFTADTGTLYTSTMTGSEGPSLMLNPFLGIDPFATPESEGSSDDSSSYDTYDDTEYSSSDDDSGTYDDDSSCDDSSESSDHSSSTISSYHSVKKVSNHHRSEKTKRRVSKKKKLLNILQGKKSVKSIDVVNDSNNNDATTNESVVDRLPDTFEDDNDENIDTNNNTPKPHGKKNHSDNKKQDLTGFAVPEEGTQKENPKAIEKQASKRKKKTKKKKRRRRKGKNKADDFEDVLASKIRVLKQLVGIEQPVHKQDAPGADPPALKFVSSDAPEENTNRLGSTATPTNQGQRQIPPAKEETIKPKTAAPTSPKARTPKLKEIATKQKQQTPTARKDTSTPNTAPTEVNAFCDSVILELPDKLVKNNSPPRDESEKQGNDQNKNENENDNEKAAEQDDNLSICGASLSLESIVSLEGLLDGDTPTFVKNVIQITNDSMRSARSIFFPDDDGSEDIVQGGMTAADEFEKEMNRMDDQIDAVINTVCSTDTTPQEIWVPEYADCDEGVDGRKNDKGPGDQEQEGGRVEFADCDEGLEASKQKDGKIEDNLKDEVTKAETSAKKRKSLRKRIPFLNFKRGGSKTGEEKSSENNHRDDASVDESLHVDIFVYNREKALVEDLAPTDGLGVSGCQHVYNGDKPLIDATPSTDDADDADQEEMTPQQLMASCTQQTIATTQQTLVTSCDMMVAAKNAVQDLEAPDDFLSLGMMLCGDIQTDNKMITSSSNDPISTTKEGQFVSSSENNNTSNGSNPRGQTVLSSNNEEKWLADVGTTLGDCGTYYMEECLPALEGPISGSLLAAAAATTSARKQSQNDQLVRNPEDEIPSKSNHSKRRHVRRNGSDHKKRSENNSSRSRGGRSSLNRKKKTMLV